MQASVNVYVYACLHMYVCMYICMSVSVYVGPEQGPLGTLTKTVFFIVFHLLSLRQKARTYATPAVGMRNRK